MPEPVLAILAKMMAKRPADRQQTASELAAAMEPYAVSGPIPWAPQPASSISLLDAPTPDGAIGATEVNADPEDVLAGLTPVPPGNSPTPLIVAPKRHERPRPGLVAGFWLIAAVILSMCAGAGLVTMILRHFAK